MALRGTAFLAIWNDIDDTLGAVDYDAWLTHEHMAERIGVPGFLRGRRWIAADPGPHRYFICYETHDLDVLIGPEYMARLNAPTPLTRQVMPHLTNFVRMGCRTVGSAGGQVGGAVATVRFVAPEAHVAEAAHGFCESLLSDQAVTACHLGSPRPEVAAVATRERALRTAGTAEGSHSHLLMVESSNHAALRDRLPGIVDRLIARVAAASAVDARVYRLSYLIEPG